MNGDLTRGEQRERSRAERPRKTWLRFEADLCNLVRKLDKIERVHVYAYAERLALAKIAQRAQERAAADPQQR